MCSVATGVESVRHKNLFFCVMEMAKNLKIIIIQYCNRKDAAKSIIYRFEQTISIHTVQYIKKENLKKVKMSGVSIITGGGSGIGRCLAKRFATRAQPVLIVGRNADKLNETKNESSNPSYIRTVVADVSLPQGRDAVLNALGKDEKVHNLVHNAALLEPVGPLMNVDLEDWRHHMAVNVEGPLFLTKLLLGRLEKKKEGEGERGGRVLHVSSGAAHHGYRGWVSSQVLASSAEG